MTETAGLLHHSTIYLDGRWVAPAAGAGSIDVHDPATDEVVGSAPACTPADVDAAVRAARAAAPAWAATPLGERTSVLAKARDLLAERAAEMAAVITREIGAPPRIASGVHVGTPLSVFSAFVDDVLPAYELETRVANSLVVREPVGVVGAITPWNWPLHQVVNKVVPALGAGCTVVLKPSEVAPLAAYLFIEILDSVGVPAGTVNLVPGTGTEVGEAIAAHRGVDLVSFTGSTRAGRRVSEVAAATVKPVALELGGKSATVVLDDADLPRAVKAGVSSAFLNSGQTCSALTRLLVPRERLEEATALAAAAADAMTAKLGPLVSRAQWERVQGYLERGLAEGARLATGGPGRPEGVDRGWYARPTVFTDVRPDMTVAQEEIFGPVLVVIPYDTEDEAVEIANGTAYGLSGAVWSADQDRAVAVARRLQAGQVDVNGGKFNPAAPFGGVKQSGHGRELGRWGLAEFLTVKSLQL